MPETCRYCFDSSIRKNNALISPCSCRGSVEFVHYKCFLRWILLVSDDRKELCPICNTKYTIDPLNLEDIPDAYPPYLYNLSSTLANIIQTVFYLASVFYIYPSVTSDELWHGYFINQCILTLLWLSEFIRIRQIKNKALYLQYLWTYSYIFYVTNHVVGLCLFGVFPTYFFIVGPVSFVFLRHYWYEHVRILDLINDGILTNLRAILDESESDETPEPFLE